LMAAQAFQPEPAALERWRRSWQLTELRGLFVDGQMRAGLTLFDMHFWFGGRPVRAGGIAGVATPPEYRRQGAVGRLLQAVLAEMRAAGQPLSLLYPFYFPFYKHYGWEHASDNHEYTIPIDRLPAGPIAGTWQAVCVATDPLAADGQRVVSDADLAVLMQIYDAWAPGRNGALVRDAVWWRTRKITPRSNIYYWRDPAGTPRALVSYTFKELRPWERQLQASFVAPDPAALRAVLGFLRNHDSQAKEVVVNLPEDDRLLALLDDPRIKAEVDPGFMLRLVDVPAALAARGYPPGVAGRLVWCVAEGFVARTPATYTLDVADGVGTVAPSTAAPDLSLDQRALSQLYSGYLTPHQAAALGLLTVHDPAALDRAALLLAGPKPYLADFF
ncbi:MAG TPA: GNAT family N-acetyltransferase, partial [Chloroflexia bacterium]|nr:GNAT family N-acetyltransferase [Chloroflexia bacterium]